MYYHARTKTPLDPDLGQGASASSEDDCFAEKATGWIYALSLVTALLFGIGVHQLVQRIGDPVQQRRGWMNAAAWSAAYRPCPYCDGMLDGAGRCNVRSCPIYSPDWGLPAPAAAPAAVRGCPVPELGVEVSPSFDGPGAAVDAVDPAGPAAAAGLQPSDVITRFNGRGVGGPRRLRAAAAAARPEADVKVVFVRAGVLREAWVRVVEGEVPAAPEPGAWAGVPGPTSRRWVQ